MSSGKCNCGTFSLSGKPFHVSGSFALAAKDSNVEIPRARIAIKAADAFANPEDSRFRDLENDDEGPGFV